MRSDDDILHAGLSCVNNCVQICVWSTGNAARPIVQAISAQIPDQKATMEGRNPASTKLAVDPFCRIEGAVDAIALGDCSRMAGRPLPATAQVCPTHHLLEHSHISKHTHCLVSPRRGKLIRCRITVFTLSVWAV